LDEHRWCQSCLAFDWHECSSGHISDFHLQDDGMTSIEQDFWLELAQIQAESIGWIPLDEGAYLHVGSNKLLW
jgi:hypothetical protein